MATNRALGIIAVLALVLGTGGGAAAGWLAGQSGSTITGATGSDGAPCPIGAPGTRGDNGTNGNNGNDGVNGIDGVDGVVPYAYVPLNNAVVLPGSGNEASPSLPSTGPVDFVQEKPWSVAEPGLYRITFSAYVEFASPQMPYVKLIIATAP